MKVKLSNRWLVPILLFVISCGNVSGEIVDSGLSDEGVVADQSLDQGLSVDEGAEDLAVPPIDLPALEDNAGVLPDLSGDVLVAIDGNDEDSIVPNCQGDLPIECVGITDAEAPECYPENTDCSSVQKDSTATYVWCTLDEVAHLDDNGALHCCGVDSSTWCDPSELVPGYPGGCQPTGSDCSTLKQCGSSVPEACSTGYESFCRGDGKVACCGGSTPFWCPPFGESVGFCRPENAGCNQAVSCDGGENWGVCSFGIPTNCSSDELLFCCTGNTPLWCAPGSGVTSGFPGRCFTPQTNCDLIGPGPDNSWVSCEADETANLDVYGNLQCCGGETPLHCPNYAGLDATYDGSQCFSANTNCASLLKDEGTGLWDSCQINTQFGVGTNQELICCDSTEVDEPVYCAASTVVADGDSAFDFSIVESVAVFECENACLSDSDCFGSVPPLKCKATQGEAFVDADESGSYEEGEDFTDTNGNGVFDPIGCNQCVANAASFSTSLNTSEGCWPAGTQCDRLYLCGGQYTMCSTSSCYCWNGTLFENW